MFQGIANAVAQGGAELGKEAFKSAASQPPTIHSFQSLTSHDQNLQRHDWQNTLRLGGELDRMLLLKNLDQSHEMQMAQERHRQALELENRKQQAAIELRKLDLDRQNNLNGLPAPTKATERHESFWQSKLFLTLLTISLPIILTALLRHRPNDNQPARRFNFRRGRRRRPFPFRKLHPGADDHLYIEDRNL